MSLLDNGPQEVTVYAEDATVDTDEYENEIEVPSATAIIVRGRWQTSTAEEAADLGQQEQTVYRFISRAFPSGPYGRVVFEGDDYDILARPKHRRGSTTTEHYTTFLKRR